MWLRPLLLFSVRPSLSFSMTFHHLLWILGVLEELFYFHIKHIYLWYLIFHSFPCSSIYQHIFRCKIIKGVGMIAVTIKQKHEYDCQSSNDWNSFYFSLLSTCLVVFVLASWQKNRQIWAIYDLNLSKDKRKKYFICGWVLDPRPYEDGRRFETPWYVSLRVWKRGGSFLPQDWCS